MPSSLSKGDVRRVRDLLSKGVNPNAEDNGGWTVLVSMKLILIAYDIKAGKLSATQASNLLKWSAQPKEVPACI